MDSINLNTFFLLIAFLANTKHSIDFAWDDLVEQFGEPIRFAKHIRKAAKKAYKHIPAKNLNNEDLVAMCAVFLQEIGLYGNNGDVIAVDNKFYMYQDMKVPLQIKHLRVLFYFLWHSPRGWQ